jgi:pimeloyl-ACP methyl ester carboxylesterase
MRRISFASVLVSLIAVVALCGGCGAGPSLRPPVAVRQGGGGSGPATSPAVSAPPKAPALQAPPKNADLPWIDCTRPTLAGLGLGPGPAGLILECSQFNAPVDVSGAIYGTVNVGVLRARLAQTPADAAPLILTSGSDRASSTTLVALATGNGAALLAAHPVVAVDRRGIGLSTPTTCMPPPTRQGLADNGQFAPGDQFAAMQTLSEQATTACKDFLQPQELTYDAPHAADDIEALRQQWQVDKIGLIGVGDGAVTATSYAQKYPDHLGRLLLDSPWALGANQLTLTEQRVQGAESALTAYATLCASVRCSLGPDPRGAIADLVRRAATGGLPGISANAVLTAISGFLGDPRPDQTTQAVALADALSSAAHGDAAALAQIIGHQTAETGTDGQFVATCSDIQQRTPLEQARQLRATWAGQYPVFGEQSAIGLATCAAWPTIKPIDRPTGLRGLPVLVLSAAADPATGNGGLPSVTGAFNAGGARTAVVTWQGFGHAVLTHSGCALQQVLPYLKDGTLPSDGMACPA